MTCYESDREKVERLRAVAKRNVTSFSAEQMQNEVVIGCCAAWLDVLYWLDTNFPVQPDQVQTVAGSLALAAMERTLKLGKEISIPSLGIVIKPSNTEVAE